ncbi:MAG: ATP-grasp domain-containing protein [Lewinella sp.]|uniref:ATP-grasp domain-containing protein n=1 Tax=Lewinella sp. TaxID=2004506 RepID=UPI003D6AA383
MARPLLEAIEQSGKLVFPNHYTAWHFDDKVAQKYLFESLNIATPKSYVFYDLDSLKKFAEKTTYPIVWKLRGGSGSRNVKLIDSSKELINLGKKMLGRGVRDYDAWDGIKETLRRYRLGSKTNIDVLKAIAHLIIPVRYEKSRGKAWGYVYLQEFIPNNEADFRVIVIGDKAFAIKRFNRPGDFRASGSGYIEYDKSVFPDSLIKLAFNLSTKLKSQCIAFDFVYRGDEPLVVEISYGFRKEGYYKCPGYWDSNMNWHSGPVHFYDWIIENLKSSFLTNG